MIPVDSVTLSAFARELGVTAQAVSKAFLSGRLRRSIARDANHRPFICDRALALQEWRGELAEPVGEGAAPGAPSSADGGGAGDEASLLSLVDSQRAVMAERTRKLRLENDVREGKLIDVDQAAKVAFEFARTLRENVLNIPSRLAAELAAEHDAARVHRRLEDALRAALEATVAVLERPPTQSEK
jgi:hypothetical protein